MQKKIIALAIAAAISTPAFADTTVYGVVDAAVARITATNQLSDTQVLSGGLSTSRFGFKNVSDIDGGMKAIINLEYGLDIAQSNTAAAGAAVNTSGVGAARQQMVALGGDFGTVAAGYLQTTGYDFGVKYDTVAGSTVSPLGNVTKGGGFLIGAVAGGARAPRALAYISPSFSGVTVAVNYSTSLDPTGTINAVGNLTQASVNPSHKNDIVMLSANYAEGAAAAGLVYTKLNNNWNNKAVPPVTSVSNTTEYALGGSYDFGVAKAFATYQSQTASPAAVASTTNKAYSLSAAIPAGPGAVVVSYAANKMVATAAGVATSARGETVAYVQDLSKTVTAYGAYTRMGQDTGTAAYSVANNLVAAGFGANTGGSSSMIAAGLRVKF